MKPTLLATALLIAATAFAPGLKAHPMGNLSVNHYARLEPGARGIDVTYVLDLAEIPTFELTQTWEVEKGASRDVLREKAAAQAREWARNLSFTEDGKALPATFISAELGILDGAGNLPVFRIASVLHVDAKGGRVEYEDRNYATRAGWREIVIRGGAGAEISRASNSDADMSRALTAYPQDPTKAPPQSLKAWFEWKPVSAPVSNARRPVIVSEAAPPAPKPAAPEPAVKDVKRDVRPAEPASAGTVKRNDTISTILRMKEISWPLMALLIGLAFWFGALHALEPGHGKTMVAAYLVGQRGTVQHAALLGGMVTFTHTVSVFLLGVATMFLSRYIMPDRISKVLGIASGISIVWIGATLLYKRWKRLEPDEYDLAHAHHQRHVHTHTHGGNTHSHGGGADSHTHLPQGEITMGSLMALGASGGLVPCPSALILLLSAISIGRIGLGMVLLFSFSLGLSIVLTATGIAVVYARNLFPERKVASSGFFRYTPVFSAAAILLIGVMMTSVSLGWIPAARFIG